MSLMRRWGVVLAIGALVALAGCGGDDAGGGGGGTEGQQAPEAKKADPNGIANATGDVTYCTGKDTSGAQKQSVEDFNKKFASKNLKAELLEFPESADEQRNQFQQRQRAKSADCDIFYSDVIWTAEFASQGWLLDMSDYVSGREDEFIPSTIETVKYGDKIWGAPKQTDAGFIYFRKDKVPQVPETWQALYEEAKKGEGFVYQGGAYEGLTVHFLELAYAAGGKVLSDDGKKSEINSPQNVQALEFMVNGIKEKAVPKAVTTYMEEPARRAFESEKADLMRNWPYAYALGKESKIADDFEVAPFPAWEGGGKAGILGGHNLVISAFSKNPNGALALIDFLTSPEVMKQDAAEFSLAPVLKATYEDPDVKEALPFAPQLLQAVEQAKSRPVSPVYTQVSQAIYKNVNSALSGDTPPAEALQKAQQEMDAALQTF